MSIHRVAVVGGSGFVGSALAEQLSKNYQVTVVDRNQSKNPSCDFLSCDIRDYDEVERALKGVDIVIHTAIIQIPTINQERKLGYDVNIIGTQNVCEAVRKSATAKGMIITGSWHTIGERKIEGVIDEKFGFRPDMVEDRARLYALCKVGQEAIVRICDEMEKDKIFGVIRIGTVLGKGMPANTAANLFIENALKRQPITPYEHSMHRPMLYVDIGDVCYTFESFIRRISTGDLSSSRSIDHIFNVYYPEPVTILELASLIKQCVRSETSGRIDPEVKIVSSGQEIVFSEIDKSKMTVDLRKLRDLIGSWKLTSPRETIVRLVKERIRSTGVQNISGKD